MFSRDYSAKSDTDQEQDIHSPQRHGFWWEIDMTYYLLVCMSWLGIVTDLRSVPERVLNKSRIIANTPDQLLKS
jgi:stearoyl-CoA desaturase (delta-9 desaturase)